MKTSFAAVSTLRCTLLRPLFPCLAAVALLCGTAVRAQEKPVEAAHAAGWVVIPVEEYRVLRAKAYPTEHEQEPPPLDATLSRGDYDLGVMGGLASGRAHV